MGKDTQIPYWHAAHGFQNRASWIIPLPKITAKRLENTPPLTGISSRIVVYRQKNRIHIKANVHPKIRDLRMERSAISVQHSD
jgi:hypothetical protein